MNNQQAKENLMLFRPGTVDQQDPEFAEALKLTKSNQELKEWFENHCARHEALCQKFRQIPVPEGLKEQILSEQRIRRIGFVSRNPAKLSLALATLVLFLAVASIWLSPHLENDFTVFQNRMPRSVLRQYPKMDIETSDLRQIRAFLSEKGQGNFVLPEGLEKATGTGCAIRQWHGQQVPMICFASGRAGVTNAPDLFLFIINRAAVSRAPNNPSPEFKQLTQEMAIASWTAGSKVYVLGGLGDEHFLRGYF